MKDEIFNENERGILCNINACERGTHRKKYTPRSLTFTLSDDIMNTVKAERAGNTRFYKMEDNGYERYGDYNEPEDDNPRGGVFVLIVKILIAIVCVAVIGLIAFRMMLRTHWSDGMKNIAFTERLTEYYEKTEGDIGAKTQKLRSEYDDPKLGNFFAGNLIVIPGIDEVQISLRFNVSALRDINAKYGGELSADDPELLSFRLYDNYGREYTDLVYCESESLLMYRFRKLVFDGVDLDRDTEYPEWIRLEIFVKGHTDEPYSKILIYENNEDYSTFTDYTLNDKERP